MKKILSILTLSIFFLIFTGATCKVPSKSVKDGGIFKSVDGGAEWKQKIKSGDKNGIDSVNVLTMAIDPFNSEIIYIGTENGIYKTENGGELWMGPAMAGSINSIAFDPKTEGTIFIINSGKIFKSINKGNEWQMVYIESGGSVNAIAIDSYDTKNIYAGTSNGGILKSIDFGNSWSILKWLDSSVNHIVVNPNNTRQIYIVAGTKFYRTNDAGANWEDISENLKNFSGANAVNCIYVKNEIYLGTQAGLLKSVDAGNSWETLRILIPPKKPLITSIAVSPKNSREIYFSSGSTVFRSLDAGINWQVNELPTSRKIEIIKMNPENPEIIYAGVRLIKQKKKGFLPYQPAPPE